MNVPIRRTDTEKIQVGDYYDGVKRYYDQNTEITIIKLMTGDCYVTADPGEMLVTILGSCISVCMRDPVAGVGGMNHFLLPGSMNSKLTKGDEGYSTRFGAFAMEELINGILSLGGKKERIETKVFGGGNVTESSAQIGTKNVMFAHEFLKNEGFLIDSEDVGDTYPRRIHYYPDTGKIMLRKLRRNEDMKIVEEEKKYDSSLIKKKKDKTEFF